MKASKLQNKNITVLKTPKALRRWRKTFTGTLGFVPTMGALHKGHAFLIKKSMQQNNATLVSIFVNPLQFGAGEDFSTYPRNDTADKNMLQSLGVTAVYMPSPKSFPIHQHEVLMQHKRLGFMYEGVSRPQFFGGVLTVVMKLLLVCQPQKIYMGKKDYQQALLIKQMVNEYGLSTKVLGVPTVREHNGLALSSRNAYLSESECHEAANIYAALKTAALLLKKKEQSKKSANINKKMLVALTAKEAETILQQAIEKHLLLPIFRLDYFALASRNSLHPIAVITKSATAHGHGGVRGGNKELVTMQASIKPHSGGRSVLLIAVYFKVGKLQTASHSKKPDGKNTSGWVRLIDNLEV